LLGPLLSLLAVVAAAAEPPSVILLSWDGTRWDYPDRVELPALRRLEREGVRAERLVPVFPTSTFPNHVSLATGAYTDGHGIVGNVFVDAERGRYAYSDDASWIEAEPIWVCAERQGVRSATFFWVGSETDWHGVGATYRKAPFDTHVPESAKVDQILAWLDLPDARRPRLILSWWHGADAAGHRYGPDAPEVIRALRGQDHELGRLLAGLDARDAWRHTTLVLVSDHGMARATNRIEARRALSERGIAADVIPLGGYGYVRLRDPERLADAVAALEAVPGVSAWPSAELPETLRARRPGRTGDVTFVATPTSGPSSARGLVDRLLTWLRGARSAGFGMHGTLPSRPDMHAIFFATGRGVSPDLELGAVRSIDVAPSVAFLLGIEPPRDAEGRRIPGLHAP
jgi:predicted AlkP superfamily pyrophosphatase or phosphodiesterase